MALEAQESVPGHQDDRVGFVPWLWPSEEVRLEGLSSLRVHTHWEFEGHEAEA
jgi:hypothetical protein